MFFENCFFSHFFLENINIYQKIYFDVRPFLDFVVTFFGFFEIFDLYKFSKIFFQNQ